MRLTRPLALRFSLVLASTAGLTSILALGGVFSCSKYETLEPPRDPECKLEDPYTYEVLDTFSSLSWWASADYAPVTLEQPTNVNVSGGGGPYSASASVTAAVPIADPGVCGSFTAGEFQASNNNDWGCIWGMWGFDTDTTKGRDASSWQGLSFWARAPGKTNKAFTLILDDDNTYSVAKENERSSGTNCRSYPTDGGTNGKDPSAVTVVVNDPGTGTPITGSSNSRSAYPDECGNGFYYIVELTSEWTFHTIPWSKFKQSGTANRVPNQALPSPDGGVDYGSNLKISGLRNLTLRAPKEAVMDVWMTKLAFYREKAQ